MQIPLDQFEQHIDETILKRGLSYFKAGHVNEPEEVTHGVYEAIVEGSEDYKVRLTIKNSHITEYTCDCPYDRGPVCKHIAAVIFHLQQEFNQKSSTGKLTKGTETVKRKTPTEQVYAVLEKISHEALKQFILEKTKSNASFRDIFLASFAPQNASESKALYLKQVKSILRTAGDGDAFIDWSAARHVGNAVSELLDTAQKHFANNHYKSTIFICCAVMEELTEALQYADDSHGYIGRNIDVAYHLLSNIIAKKIPEDIRKWVFEYCLSAFEKQIYVDWDWHFGMLQLAAQMVKNDEEAQRIIAFLDEAPQAEYEPEEVQVIKLQILKKTKGEKEAAKFIAKNLSNPSLRQEAIAKAILHKNYAKAISIARDGVTHDAKDKPGLVKEWYNWLLKIAMAQNEKDKIIEYARLLFIDNFKHEQDYYQLMKNNVQLGNWNNFAEEIIKDITTKEKWLDFELIAGIYVKEEWWNRLIAFLQQNPSLNYIERYEKYLSKHYAAELAQLYADGIIQYMKNSTGRNHYQMVCRYLRRMIKLGAQEKVDHIVEIFRKEYPQRRALMEELRWV